jgi:hypothetical protein
VILLQLPFLYPVTRPPCPDHFPTNSGTLYCRLPASCEHKSSHISPDVVASPTFLLAAFRSWLACFTATARAVFPPIRLHRPSESAILMWTTSRPVNLLKFTQSNCLGDFCVTSSAGVAHKNVPNPALGLTVPRARLDSLSTFAPDRSRECV